jgi:hypothetical protein
MLLVLRCVSLLSSSLLSTTRLIVAVAVECCEVRFRYRFSAAVFFASGGILIVVILVAACRDAVIVSRISSVRSSLPPFPFPPSLPLPPPSLLYTSLTSLLTGCPCEMCC